MKPSLQNQLLITHKKDRRQKAKFHSTMWKRPRALDQRTPAKVHGAFEMEMEGRS